MKPRSSLTLRNPPEANENRKKFSNFLLFDSVSPYIRRSVQRCLADLNIGYRSTLQGGGLKTILINPGNKEKSTNSMSARRKTDRTHYLDSKRQSNGLPHIHEVTTPPSSADEMETQATKGASSLESLQRLVTERKEYLEMSQNRKRKVQWYARVTRQSKQLLNFLRTNDQSAGDTIDNCAAKLVLAHAPVSAESGQAVQPVVTSRVTSARRETPSSERQIAVTTPEEPRTAKKDSNRKRNKSAQRSCDNKRQRYALRTNGDTKAQKLSGHMAKSNGQDGLVQLENTNQLPISSTARVTKRIQDVRLALTADMSGNTHADNETGSIKRKMTWSDDKENEELEGPHLQTDSSRLRATAGVLNRRDAPHFNRAPGAARQNFNHFNNNNNDNTINNIGALRNGETGLRVTRKIPGAQPSNQTWSTMKRKRISFNGPMANNEPEEEGRCSGMYWVSGAESSGTEAMGPLKEAMGPRIEAMGPSTEAMGPRTDESLWMTLKNIWRKQEKSGGGAAEDVSRAPPLGEDPVKGGTTPTTGTCKTTPRTRVGRSVKRRRREVKPPTVWTTEVDADDVVGLQDFPTCGSRTGRHFVIPDKPYDVDEALSMDLMNAAYDFIHNG